MSRKRVNAELLESLERKLRCVQNEISEIKQKNFSLVQSENEQISGSDGELELDFLQDNRSLFREPLLEFIDNFTESTNQGNYKMI